jgi:hypothetical protein
VRPDGSIAGCVQCLVLGLVGSCFDVAYDVVAGELGVGFWWFGVGRLDLIF